MTAPVTNRWGVPVLLMLTTFLSMLYVGALMAGSPASTIPWLNEPWPQDLWAGWTFAVPLMAILMAHEFAHFVAGKIHGVDVSPPYFIPMPKFLLGTMGAVISIRSTIRTRNALLDVGASGPLAGMVIALPVLAYGVHISPVEPMPETGNYLMEGRSLLYSALLSMLKGPIPEGHDIFLSPTAFAGWAGLLVTMINLIPVGQLDGGHVAYALWGPRQNVISERVRHALVPLGLCVGAYYAGIAWNNGATPDVLIEEGLSGMQWLVWAGLLWIMTRMSGPGHPPTEDSALSPVRKGVAALTLLLFVMLFMPYWVKSG